jgi:hypothetical protein
MSFCGTSRYFATDVYRARLSDDNTYRAVADKLRADEILHSGHITGVTARETVEVLRGLGSGFL